MCDVDNLNPIALKKFSERWHLVEVGFLVN